MSIATAAATIAAIATSATIAASPAGAAGGIATAAGPQSPSGLAIRDGRTWYLRATPTAGPATSTFVYGSGGAEVAVMGDWDGDGDETVGVVRWTPGSGGSGGDPLTWYLRDDNSGGPATVPPFSFGAMTMVAVDMLGATPVVGDWDGDGTDTVGVAYYDQDMRAIRWVLIDQLTSSAPQQTFTYGSGRDRPLAGDWDGDGDDEPGVYREPDHFLLRSTATSGNATTSFLYGSGSVLELPVIGDWDGDGTDTVGILRNRPASDPDGGFEHWLLRDSNTAGPATHSVVYGNDRFRLDLPIEQIPRLSWR